MKRIVSGLAMLAVIVLALGCARTSPSREGIQTGLYRMPSGVETRWASPENWKGERGVAALERGGRKGSPCFALASGASKILAEVKGRSGTVRRIWITINDRSPEMLRGLKLEMYWDGAANPAVAVPVGDFFCQGLGRMSAFENALFASPEGRSFNCYIPMPFRSGMKIVVTNESGKDLRAMYYDVDYTLGDRHAPDTLYFHAAWHRQNPTTLQRDFELLPKVSGRGRFLGACVSVIPDKKKYNKSWWGEGEVKVYLDGDGKNPTLSGTGTEDYIGTGWGQGQYATNYIGCQLADPDNFQYAFYRLHIPDPVWFHNDCKVTIQQIGYTSENTAKAMLATGETYYMEFEKGMGPVPPEKFGTPGYNLYERQDDWAACAWFYLDRPENSLPALALPSERMAGLGVPKK